MHIIKQKLEDFKVWEIPDYGLDENGISPLQIGFQLLREPCYHFYQVKDQVINRKLYSNSVKAEIRSKILEYLDNEYYAIKNLRFLFT